MEQILTPTYSDDVSYLRALEKQGRKVGVWAAKMLENLVVPIVPEEKREVTIVKVAPEDLELHPYRSNTSPENVIAAAKRQELETLPIWAVLEYLLQFDGNAEHVLIGIEPMKVCGMRRIFCITNYSHWHLFWGIPEAGRNKGNHPIRLQSRRGSKHVHYMNHDWLFAKKQQHAA